MYRKIRKSGMSSTTTEKFQHVNELWDDAVAMKLSPAERLVYRSNCLGADQRITNTGGGNTSSKIHGDRSADGGAGRHSLGQGIGRRLADVKNRKLRVAVHGQATESDPQLQRRSRQRAQDPRRRFDGRPVSRIARSISIPRASSIDTPLHGFLPARHVDHMHPNSVISIAACQGSRELTPGDFR